MPSANALSKQLSLRLLNWGAWAVDTDDLPLGEADAEDMDRRISTLPPRQREALRVMFVDLPFFLDKASGGFLTARQLLWERADAMGVSEDIYETLCLQAIAALLTAPSP